jgi:ArsR family transcriptional regulator
MSGNAGMPAIYRFLHSYLLFSCTGIVTVTVTITQTDKASPTASTLSATNVPPDPETDGHQIPQLQEKMSKDLVKFFKLLSDETRLRILFSLYQTNELHVRALCDLLQLSQPAVSHHLGMLRNADVVEPRRDGKHNFYRILPGRCRDLLAIVFDSIPEGTDMATFNDLQFDPPRRPK